MDSFTEKDRSLISNISNGNYHIAVSIFNNETYEENLRWRREKSIEGCVYGMCKPLPKSFNYGSTLFVLEMNNDLNETNPLGTFITSIVGKYNLKSDLVEISNAGHQPALLKIGKNFKEFPSSSMPLAITKHKDETVYDLKSFKLDGGRIYCFTDGFSECLDENNKEIGIDGVKELILKHENSSLRKELEIATEEIRLKSLKTGFKEKGIKENNDILDDDLTIIGIGK